MCLGGGYSRFRFVSACDMRKRNKGNTVRRPCWVVVGCVRRTLHGNKVWPKSMGLRSLLRRAPGGLCA
jgi:hypothetical protein